MRQLKLCIRYKLLSFAVIILICNGILCYAVFAYQQQFKQERIIRANTEKIIAQTNSIILLEKQAEVAFRAFLISGNKNYLVPVTDIKTKIDARIGQLKSVEAGNPVRLSQIVNLDYHLQKRFQIARQMIRIRSQNGLAAAIFYGTGEDVEKLQLTIEAKVISIQNAEMGMHRGPAGNSGIDFLFFSKFWAVVFIFMVMCSALLLILISKYLKQHKEKELRAAELVLANKELAFQNKEKEMRAQELALANDELVFENEEKEKREDELIETYRDLKRTEEALRESNELFFKLFNNNPSSIAVRQISTGKLIKVNDAFLKMFGFKSRDEVIGKTTLELKMINESEHEIINQAIKNESDLMKDHEKLIRTNDGEMIWISSSFILIEIDNEPCLLAVTNDITERKKIEEALKVANIELAFENIEKEKRAAELMIANMELEIAHKEKLKRAEELLAANRKLIQGFLK